jgi:hypothetical protein
MSAFFDATAASPGTHLTSTGCTAPTKALPVKKLDTLQQALGGLVDDAHLSDVIFFVGPDKTTIYGHKLLFAAQSEPFRAMLYGNMKEAQVSMNGCQVVELPDMDPVIFRKIQTFLYKGEVEIEMEEVMDILQASHKYSLEALRLECCLLLQNSLTRDNVLTILEVAILYEDKNLQLHCLSGIGQHAGYILSKEEFCSLSKDAVTAIISSNKLCIEEIEVFKAVLRWRDFAPLERQEEALALMEHVRLPLISAEDLHTIVKPSGLASLEVLLEAMTFHAAPHTLDTNPIRFQMREGTEIARPYVLKKQPRVMYKRAPKPGLVGFFASMEDLQAHES